MEQHQAEMLRIIRDIDAEAAMRLHKHLWPHFPAPSSAAEATASLHHARTGLDGMPDKLRCYSHAWLRDRGLPSNLPDRLKQKAERLYPVSVQGVGVATRTRTPLAQGIRGAMEDAVRETFADGHQDQPEIVKARMLEMRERFIKRDGNG
jgi:hypothetical protein